MIDINTNEFAAMIFIGIQVLMFIFWRNYLKPKKNIRKFKQLNLTQDE